MGSFSIWHWLIVLLIVMMIFGTKKLRNIGEDLGGAVKGFKQGMRAPEIGGVDGPEINREIQVEELKKMQNDVAARMHSMEQSVAEQMKTVESDLNQSLVAGIEEKAAAVPAAADAVPVAAPAPADAAPAAATPVAAASAPASPDKPQA